MLEYVVPFGPAIPRKSSGAQHIHSEHKLSPPGLDQDEKAAFPRFKHSSQEFSLRDPYWSVTIKQLSVADA